MQSLIADLRSHPIMKFLKTSVEFFQSVYVSNIIINSSIIFDSSFFQISNALQVSIENTYIMGACNIGPLLAVGVKYP